MAEMVKEAQGPDPAVVANEVYHLILENERVRVFDVQFKPGAEAIMHWHPDHVVYVLADYTLDLRLSDGSTPRVPLKAGQVIWMQSGSHAAKNIADTEGHAIVVELKPGKGA